MKPNEIEHEIMRRNFWCAVYVVRSPGLNEESRGVNHPHSREKIRAAADMALEDYDKKFKTLPESVKPYINTSPK